MSNNEENICQILVLLILLYILCVYTFAFKLVRSLNFIVNYSWFGGVKAILLHRDFHNVWCYRDPGTFGMFGVIGIYGLSPCSVVIMSFFQHGRCYRYQGTFSMFCVMANKRLSACSVLWRHEIVVPFNDRKFLLLQ